MKEIKMPKQTEVTPVLQLGGRAWPMKVTHNVLQRFSALARCNLMQIQELMGRYDMATMFLWLMMAEQDEKLTRGEVDRWLNELPVFEALEVVMENTAQAIRSAFPQPEDPSVPQEQETDGEREATGEKAPDPTA